MLPVNDNMAIDRALDLLPHSPEKDRLLEALIDDGYEEGLWPRYAELQTVGYVKRAGISGLVSIANLDPEDAQWLIAQFGGARRGRPKGSRNKPKETDHAKEGQAETAPETQA